MLLTFPQEQAIEAAGALRGDPLLYVLVVVLLSGIGGLFILFWRERKTNIELTKSLADSLNALTTIVSNIEKNQSRLETRYETSVEKIDTNVKGHIETLLNGLKLGAG